MTECIEQENVQNSAYDVVAYPSLIFAMTRPSRLASLAHVFGLSTPPLSTARVLEIGGSDGLNLMAMAAAYPNSEFVSFDLAQSAVKRGADLIKLSGLTNVRVEYGDIMTWASTDKTQYDYIIAHGIYAWVPPEVQDAIFDLIAKLLSPNGVAYISYNAYPGCYSRKALRDYLYPLVCDIEDVGVRISKTHAALDAYIALAQPESAIEYTLVAEAKHLREKDVNVLFHDELGGVFSPQYITDIVRKAGRFGLDYLSEAAHGSFENGLLSEEDDLRGHSDIIDALHFRDFVKGTAFHNSLFVKTNLITNRKFDPSRLRELYATTTCLKVDEGGFRNHNNQVDLSDPQMIAIMQRLVDAAPGCIRIGELTTKDLYLKALFTLYDKGFIDLSPEACPYATGPFEETDCPCTSPLARANIHLGAPFVPTLSHVTFNVPINTARDLISLFDGNVSIGQARSFWHEKNYHEEIDFDKAIEVLKNNCLIMKSS